MSIAPATLNVPKEPAERRVWICGQLRLRGTSLRKLAGQAGVSHQAMSNALIGPSSHLEPIIAEALGLRTEQLFPERFGANGQRLAHTRHPQRSTAHRTGNVQSEKAA